MFTSDSQNVIYIKRYCAEIESTIEHFGRNFNVFACDIKYQNSACMSLIKIGIAVRKLSLAFVAEHANIGWQNYDMLSYVLANKFEEINKEVLFKLITVDIPRLFLFCKQFIVFEQMKKMKVSKIRDIHVFQLN
ncbi:MAG: hypothetical protein LBS29_04515 [Endomicrobium sp.]|jgi:uncharacterized protein with HEPN domain|nr:hypothetical protein [Endomicrobium sp.]